jgi:hypothetical protein
MPSIPPTVAALSSPMIATATLNAAAAREALEAQERNFRERTRPITALGGLQRGSTEARQASIENRIAASVGKDPRGDIKTIVDDIRKKLDGSKVIALAEE